MCNEELELIVNKVSKKLQLYKRTLAVAESCTGGLISYLITRKPGASNFFLLSAVTYSNEAKEKILDIDVNIINKNGAVSSEVACLMAEGIKNVAGSHYAIAVTGLAGPSGGNKLTSAGTVYIAVTDNEKTVCSKFNFSGSRNQIQLKAAYQAFEMILNSLT